MMFIVVIGFFVFRFWNGNLLALLGLGAVVIIGLIAYQAYTTNRNRRRSEQNTRADVESLTTTVESMLGDTANAILEVEDRPTLSADPEATKHFQRAVTIFASVDDRLGTADTPEQLRLLVSDLDEALWRLGAAQALLDGEPVPEQKRPVPPTPAPRVTNRSSAGDAVARWTTGGSGRHQRRRGGSC